jgi:hypothetical protein
VRCTDASCVSFDAVLISPNCETNPRQNVPEISPIFTAGTYARSQITQMAAMRRRGEISDAEWAKWEHELIAAGKEGRIRGALDPRRTLNTTKKTVSSSKIKGFT